MTIFSLEEKEGVWFEMEGGGRVKIREMSSDDFKEIRKQTVKKKIEYKRVEGKAERFMAEDIDDDLQTELFWDHIIIEWENLFDGKGKEIPCTRENKVLLLNRSLKFLNFVTNAFKMLTEDAAREAEISEKN
jgi:hypothetical protein